MITYRINKSNFWILFVDKISRAILDFSIRRLESHENNRNTGNQATQHHKIQKLETKKLKTLVNPLCEQKIQHDSLGHSPWVGTP